MERSTGLRKGTSKGKVGGLVQHTMWQTFKNMK